MKLFSRSKRFYNYHVSQDIAKEFEEEIPHESASVFQVYKIRSLIHALAKVLVTKPGNNISRFPPTATGSTFAIYMGPDFLFINQKINSGYIGMANQNDLKLIFLLDDLRNTRFEENDIYIVVVNVGIKEDIVWARII